MNLSEICYEFSVLEIDYAINKIIVSKETKSKYNMEEKAGLVYGISKESRAKTLISMLDGVKSVRLAKSGSIMDAKLKADVAVELEDGRCGIIQIKSSEAGAKAHMDKECIEYKEDIFNIPGVYWFEKDITNMEALKEFSIWFELEINRELQEAIHICKQFAEKRVTLKVNIVKKMFPREMFDWLKFLGKIHISKTLDVTFN